MKRVRECVRWLQKYARRIWYPPFIGVLAALDNLIVIVPTDGILVSSTILTPRRWAWLAFCISFGSTIGAIILAAIVEWHGLPWILDWYPHIIESQTWVYTDKFFEQYGLILVFVIAATPLMQQPAIILASLANTSLIELAAVVFAGRFLKYLLMAYLASHAPRLLKNVWGIRGDMDDAGVKIQ